MKHKERRWWKFNSKCNIQNPIYTSTNVNKMHNLELNEPNYGKEDVIFKDTIIGYPCLY